MAVDVSRIPNNNKFDPVREAILQLQSEIEDTGAAIGNGTLTIGTSGSLSGSGTFTANQSGNSTITIGIDDSDYVSLSETSLQTLSGSLSLVNATLSGYLRGPSTFVIDPAAHGDDTGTVVIAGNLQVDGTTTTINSTTLTVDDKNIVIASGAADATAANGAGITIDGASATITYNSSSDRFDFNKDISTGVVTASDFKSTSIASPNKINDLNTIAYGHFSGTAPSDAPTGGRGAGLSIKNSAYSANIEFTGTTAYFRAGNGTDLSSATWKTIANQDWVTSTIDKTYVDNLGVNADQVDGLDATDFTLDYVTDNNSATTNSITLGASSVSGGRMLSKTYSGSNRLNVLSSMASSGNLLIGYGLEGSGTALTYLSTYENFSGRHGGIEVFGSGFNYVGDTSNSQTTIGDEITTTTFLSFNSGNLSITNNFEAEGGNHTLGSSDNTGTTLNIVATNTAGAPATTTDIRMSGYESRGQGIFFVDSSNAGEEWFAGINYGASWGRYSIGYDAEGGQSEYTANALLTVHQNGNVDVVAGDLRMGTTVVIDSNRDIFANDITANELFATSVSFEDLFLDNASGASLVFRNPQGNTVDTDNLATMSFQGYYDSAFVGASRIQVKANEDFSATARGTVINFDFWDTGSVYDTVASIDSSGLYIGTTNVYDNLPDGITYSTTDNRLKIGVSKNIGSTTETNIQPILLADILTEGYIPYVATGDGGSTQGVNSRVSDSWLQLVTYSSEDTLQLGVYDPLVSLVRPTTQMRLMKGVDMSTYHDMLVKADEIVVNMSATGGGSTASLQFVNDSGSPRIGFNNAYEFPATDGTAGQVLTTDGSGDLSWGDGLSTIDLQDVTNNGSTTTNSITVGGTSSGALASNKQGIVIEGTGGQVDAAQDGTEKLPTLQFYDSVTNYGSNTATIGESRGGVEWYTSETSSNFPAISGAIYSINENTYNTKLGLAFYTNYNTTSPIEVMRIEGGGNINLLEGDYKVNGSTVIDTAKNVFGQRLFATDYIKVNSTSPIILIQDTNSTGSAMTGYLSFRDSTDTEKAWIGYGTTTNSVLGINNSLGDIELYSKTVVKNILEINRAGDKKLRFVDSRSGANIYSIEHDTSQIYFYNETTGEAPLLIEDNGNVRINAGTLSVIGGNSIVTDGGITVGSPTFTASAGEVNVESSIRVGSGTNYLYIGEGTINRAGTADVTIGENLVVTGNLTAVGGAFTDPVTIYDSDATENPRLSVGRNAGERLRFDVEDRTALITHQQDEGTGSHELWFTIDSPTTNIDDKVFRWMERAANGASSNTLMSLNSTGLAVGSHTPTATYDKTLHVLGVNPTIRVETNNASGWAYHQFVSPDATWSWGMNAADDLIIAEADGFASNTRFKLENGGNATYYNRLTVNGELHLGDGNIRSDASYDFLTSAGGAQQARFKKIQVSGSYSGTIPDDGILFGTDSTLYRSAATELATNSQFLAPTFANSALGTGTVPTTGGWYKIGKIDSRGGGIIHISYIGGSFTPVTYEIKYYKDWTTNTTLKLEKYGAADFVLGCRIRLDSSDSKYYIELNFNTTGVTHSFLVYHNKLMGYNATGTIYTGALSAGSASGTTYKELEFYDSSTTAETFYTNRTGGFRVDGVTNGDFIELSANLPGYSSGLYGVVRSGGSIHFANNDKYSAYIEGNDTYFGILNSSQSTKVLLNTNGTSYFNGGTVVINGTAPTFSSAQLEVQGILNLPYSGSNANYFRQGNAFGFGYMRPFDNTGSFAFDTNYSSGGGYSFKYNGSEVLRIDSLGNVGIGSTPQDKLDVSGNIRVRGVGNGLYFDTTNSDASNFIKSINDYETLIANGRGSAGFAVIGHGNIRLGFGSDYTNAQTKLFINANGQVGIGTVPSSQLEVRAELPTHQLVSLNRSDSDTAAMYLGNDSSNNAVIAANNARLIFGKDVSNTFTEYMRIDTSGNVSFGDGSAQENVRPRFVNASVGYLEGQLNQNFEIRARSNSSTEGLIFSINGTEGARLRHSGDFEIKNTLGVGNRQFINAGHFSQTGTSNGIVLIKLPGSTSNYSMPVFRVTTYEYNSNSATVYYISGHNWYTGGSNYGWYNEGVTALGHNPEQVRFGNDGSKHVIAIGDFTSAWSYLSVTVEVMVHPSYYSSAQDFHSGCDIVQTTSSTGISLGGNRMRRNIQTGAGTSNTGFNTVSPSTTIDCNGNISIRNSNYLYFGQSTDSLGTWTTRQYASSSTHYNNAQTFIWNNEGYGTYEHFRMSSGGAIYNTDQGSAPFYFCRYGGASATNQALSIRTDDYGSYIQTYQDETTDGYGSLTFIIDDGAPLATTDFKDGATVRFRMYMRSGDFHADGDVIAFSSTTSDAKFKDNVVTIDNALDKVKRLRGVEYDWNATSRKGQRDLGFIAQEVEEVIPEIVREKELTTGDFADNPTTAKTVDYEKMVAVLVEAVKEQQKQIDELKARLDART